MLSYPIYRTPHENLKSNPLEAIRWLLSATVGGRQKRNSLAQKNRSNSRCGGGRAAATAGGSAAKPNDFSRESLYIGALFRFAGQQVVDILADLKTRRGAPEAIRVDNGPEFRSVALDQWACWQQTTLIFSRPGQPTDNGLIEAFNARLRQEFLNAHWFVSLKEVQRNIEQWRQHYNQERPHSSLGDLTPNEFAQMHRNTG